MVFGSQVRMHEYYSQSEIAGKIDQRKHSGESGRLVKSIGRYEQSGSCE